MEKKTQTNVSSGAKKVERIERAKEAARAAGKKSGAAGKKRTSASGGKRAEGTPRREIPRAKKEGTDAEKRIQAAQSRAAKKEQKLIRRAELKQRKMELRAAHREQKLAARSAAEKRRDERREKKLEQRAAKRARREMLQSESKTERENRIRREKQERAALRRQKHEARASAAAEKRRAREAAHARKAEDRRHRREQRTERRSRTPGFGGWLAAVISLGTACLILATVVTAGALRMNDATLQAENSFRATLYELVSVTEDLDNNLSKLRVSSGAGEQRRLITEVLVDSALMESAVERIPVDAATGTDISAFINRTNRFARGMLTKLAAGESLGEEEMGLIGRLYETNAALSAELTDLATHMTGAELRAFLQGKEGTLSERFSGMGTDVHAARGRRLPPEGEVQNRLSGEEEVSAARAEELAREYFEGYHVAAVRREGETVSRPVACYNFTLVEEGGGEIFAQIAKRGGALVFFDTFEVCSEQNFDLDACEELAASFLEKLGMADMAAVWKTDAGMVADLTFVRVQEGVRVYADMVRVRVCESKGRVVGMDASPYLTAGKTQPSLEAGMPRKEAQAHLSRELTPQSANLALIPFEGEERLAYEFFCTCGEEQYLVYLDAQSGEELFMLRVRQGSQGSYLR